MRRRLSHFVALRPSAAEKGEGRLASRVLVGAERSLESTRWWARVKDALELADIHMPAVHVAAWTAVATVLASWLVAVATVTPLALAGLAVPLAVRAFVLRRIRRKQALFADQLPDNLQVLSSALRAGHSFVGALSVVVDDAYEPSQSEFRRVVGDEQLGVPLEDALEVVVLRMDNRDLKQVALVAALQRQTGGNMAEVLDRVSETIRERAELRAMVRTLTAQGRMSRWVVSALPVVLLLVISGLNPAYVSPLFTEPAGQIALGVAAGMVVSGSLVIKRIVNIKL
jgi:tight adherence protein B